MPPDILAVFLLLWFECQFDKCESRSCQEPELNLVCTSGWTNPARFKLWTLTFQLHSNLEPKANSDIITKSFLGTEPPLNMSCHVSTGLKLTLQGDTNQGPCPLPNWFQTRLPQSQMLSGKLFLISYSRWGYHLLTARHHLLLPGCSRATLCECWASKRSPASFLCWGRRGKQPKLGGCSLRFLKNAKYKKKKFIFNKVLQKARKKASMNC